jgi:cystathionine gamma-synthase
MRTLYLRARASSRGAQVVAEALAAHPAVSRVFYPGLPDHPTHQIAARQMKDGFGALLSFRVRGGEAAARAVASNTRVIKQATSLGGVESLIEHRASIEGPSSGLPDDLLRLAVGIEAPEDLVADLRGALDAAR